MYVSMRIHRFRHLLFMVVKKYKKSMYIFLAIVLRTLKFVNFHISSVDTLLLSICTRL